MCAQIVPNQTSESIVGIGTDWIQGESILVFVRSFHRSIRLTEQIAQESAINNLIWILQSIKNVDHQHKIEYRLDLTQFHLIRYR